MLCKKEIKHINLVLFLFALLILYNPAAEAQIEVGDTLQFWSVSYIDWQPDTLISQRLITAVCRKTGSSCYVFTDIALLQTPGQQAINTLVSVFDTSYSARLPLIYGPVPDEFDNDPRVFILVVEPEGWHGYFDPAHQMPDTMVYRIWQKHSSQREIIYVSRTAFSDNSYLMVLAHEFSHMLHWGRDHSPEPPVNPVIYWEDTWIDEAFAAFGMVYLTENLSAANVYDPGAFFSVNPDLPLIHFISGYSYNQVKLWMVFMYEHYGGFEFISELINDQANGIQGVVNTLQYLGYNISFDDMFVHWALANYLDDETYLNGKYGYHHYNFPACQLTRTHNTFPVGQQIDSVASYASDYVAFTTSMVRPVSVLFECDSVSKFRLSFILLNTQNTVPFGIVSMSVDSVHAVSFNAGGFGSQYNKIIMAVMNTDPALSEDSSSRYTYSAVLSSGITPVKSKDVYSYRLGQNYPNPFNPVTNIKFEIPKAGDVRLAVYDITGREVEILVNEKLNAGTYETEFNGSMLNSGAYFYKLQSGDFTETRKMMMIK